MSWSHCLVDTNVLLRLARPPSEPYRLCQKAITFLTEHNCVLYFTLQNASEFWNVSTRPREQNGYGLSPRETRETLAGIENTMLLLPDNDRVYTRWRDLITTHNVRGVQVHDAKLAAAMLAHAVPHILTFNTADFDRYPGIEAIHPAALPTA